MQQFDRATTNREERGETECLRSDGSISTSRNSQIGNEEKEEEEKCFDFDGRLLCSAGLDAWMMTFVVGIARFVRFATATASIVVRGFRRVKIDQMNIFHVFAFRNVHRRSFR